MSPAIELTAVTHDFAAGLGSHRVRAVDGLTLAIGRGEVFGLLGPNGSGKSTTLKILLGLLSPTAGEANVMGFRSGTDCARQQLGFVPEAPYFYRHLTARELVRFYARLCGVPRSQRERRIEAVLRDVGLLPAADRRIATYSKGMLQRAGLAQAIVHDPAVVILDEPSAGLDAEGVDILAAALRSLRQAGKTVVITSHLLPQIESWCDRIGVLKNGRLVFSGDVNAMVRVRTSDAILRESLSGEEQSEVEAWMATRTRAWESVETRRGCLPAVYDEMLNERSARESGER